MADSSSSTPRYHVPPEIVQYILSLLPTDWPSVQTLVACTLVSKGFSTLSKNSNLIWTRQAHWKTNGTPRPSDSEEGGAAAYHAMRVKKDCEARQGVWELVKSNAKTNRLPCVDQVAKLGLDVYDALCELFEEEDEAVDPEEEISTSYWARELVGVILRRNAVETWEGIANGTSEDDPDALLSGLGALPADRFRHETQDFLRFLDHVVDTHVLPHLREGAHDPHDVEETAARIGSTLHELRLLPDFFSYRRFLDTVDKDPVDGSDQLSSPNGDTDGFLSPSVLAVAIFCAVVARLPAEFDIQAYPSLDPSDRPLACFGRASAKVGDAGGWWCSNLIEPLRCEPRDVIIDRLCENRYLLRDEAQEAFLPVPTRDLVLCHFIELHGAVSLFSLVLPNEPGIRQLLYRATQALITLRHEHTSADVALIDYKRFYTTLEQNFPYDVELLDTFFAPHTKPGRIPRNTSERIRSRDRDAAVSRRRSRAPVPVQFRVGVVLDLEELGPAAIVGWQWWSNRKPEWHLDYIVIDCDSHTHKVPADMLKATCGPVTEEDFEELLEAEKLGYYFRKREGWKLVPNAMLAAQYPEDWN